MHLKLLCDFKPNFIVLIMKIKKTHLSHKTGSKYKKSIYWESNPNSSMTVHHLYHRPKNDLDDKKPTYFLTI